MKGVKIIVELVGGILLFYLLIVVVAAILKTKPGEPLEPQLAISPTKLESPSQAATSQVFNTLGLAYPTPFETMPAMTQVDIEYPYPIWTFPTLTPANTVTRVPFSKITTRTPFPITPFPTLTLKPGPSPTLIPIKEPAADARGTIFFIAKEKNSANSAFYSMEMDATGKKTSPAGKLSENEFPTGDLIFPSPNGEYIAIIGEWGVFSIFNTETQTFEKSAMTSIGGDGIFFNWFPDNRRMLWGAGSLVLSDPFTGEHTVLAVPGYGRIWAAAASPNGEYVVYVYSSDAKQPRGLWIVNTNGQNAHLLVKDIAPHNIAWSPDGKQIAFFEGDLKIINADGSNFREIAPDVILPLCYSNPPLWSPDSRSLAVTTSKSGQAFCGGWTDGLFKDTNIILTDVESGKTHPLLSDDSKGNIDPAWSPDGSQIAFVSNRGGSPAVWAVNVDGSNLRQLTKGYQLVRFPMWR